MDKVAVNTRANIIACTAQDDFLQVGVNGGKGSLY